MSDEETEEFDPVEDDSYDADFEEGILRESADGEMSFLDHLEEFRWTVARSAIAFFVGIIVVVSFMPHIGSILQMPLVQAYGSTELVQERLVTYKPMGVFSVFIQVALLGGLVLSMPFVLYFLACFIAPGLTDRERKVVGPACFGAFGLFISGVMVAFFVVLPLTLTVSVKFNQMMDFQVLLAASEYYNMVVWFSLASGAVFQFPLVLVILIFIQAISVVQLRAMRRFVFVGMMVFAAFITPGGDFLSLPITTGILYGLYEIAILVGVQVEKKRLREEAEEAEAELE